MMSDDLLLWRRHHISHMEATARHEVTALVFGETPDGFKPNAALRLSEDKTRVETSQGAQVLSRTVRFLWAYCLDACVCNEPVPAEVVAQFPVLDHYRVESIDAAGNLTVGCHRIAFGELQEIARALNLPPFNGQPEQVPTLPETEEGAS